MPAKRRGCSLEELQTRARERLPVCWGQIKPTPKKLLTRDRIEQIVVTLAAELDDARSGSGRFRISDADLDLTLRSLLEDTKPRTKTKRGTKGKKYKLDQSGLETLPVAQGSSSFEPDPRTDHDPDPPTDNTTAHAPKDERPPAPIEGNVPISSATD